MGKYFYLSVVLTVISSALVLRLCTQLIERELSVFVYISNVIDLIVPLMLLLITVLITFLITPKEVEYERDLAYTHHEELVSTIKRYVNYVCRAFLVVTIMLLVMTLVAVYPVAP